MRKTVVGTLAVLMILLSAIPAGADEKEKDKKDEPDHFILYRIAGRTWLMHRDDDPAAEGGDHKDSYFRYEVRAAWDDRAEVAQSILDEGKKPTEGEPFVIKVEFKKDGALFKDPIGFRKTKEESVKTEAGTFKCVLWTATGNDGDAKLWRSVDFPGLIVKQSDRFGTRTVIEFDWVEGDPGYKADKKKKKKPEPDKIEDNRLYSTKGTLWVLRTDITRGERGSKSIDVLQYEVKKVDDKQCELEVCKLTQLLQKLKGEEPETRIIKFDDSLKDLLQPAERCKVDRTEKRITKVGLFECIVYSFKDEEGRAGMAWYASKWPGLMLKREVKGKDYNAVTELIKFEE